ncbi:LytTR family DNA-binding domain-containing protein [soil metagenome]
MKMRVIVVDDEPLARDRLRRFLSGDAQVEIVAECADGPAAVEAVRKYQPDLLLLDVQMPGMDGFEVLRELGRQAPPQVVFVTGHDEHAVKAFEARAIDYLLKPTNKVRLYESLRRVSERMEESRQELPQALLALLNERKAAPGVRRLSIRDGDKVAFVPIEEIHWLEAAGNYVVVHVANGSHIQRETMSAMESQLPNEIFYRVSRSAIVNLKRVKEVVAVGVGEYMVVLSSGQRVPTTRTLKEIEERLRFAG